MSDVNMIKKRDLNSWSEFGTAIDEIRRNYGYYESPIGNEQTYKHENTILFRGQASTRWHLDTTLERKTKQEFTLTQYLHKARKIVPELESYTGIKWNLPNDSTLNEMVKEQADKLFGPDSLPCYEYLVYLRHHGYPSPLLDWSESPYIAAYFAMCDADPKEKRVTVFAYIGSINTGKGKDFYREGDALIQEKGPRITTHKRHYLQKAQYTIALKWSEEHQAHVFCFHDEVFDKKHPKQDILIKITIPISDRKLALKDLEDHNINHFTLFQTEDSLVKTLSMREFDL
jgi:hypothetical protein